MGNSFQLQTINQTDWKFIQGNIYQKTFDGFQVQLYQVKVQQSQIENYLHQYTKRLRQDTPYVRIIQYYAKQQGCVIINHLLMTFTERIIRLPLLYLSFEQSIWMLKQIFESLQLMKEQFGYIKLTADMIGVNNEGKVKIWLNENFAQIYKQTLNKKVSEKKIPVLIRSIITLIGKQNSDHQFIQYFSNIEIQDELSNIQTVLAKIKTLLKQLKFKVQKIYLDREEFRIKEKKQKKESYSKSRVRQSLNTGSNGSTIKKIPGIIYGNPQIQNKRLYKRYDFIPSIQSIDQNHKPPVETTISRSDDFSVAKSSNIISTINQFRPSTQMYKNELNSQPNVNLKNKLIQSKQNRSVTNKPGELNINNIIRTQQNHRRSIQSNQSNRKNKQLQCEEKNKDKNEMDKIYQRINPQEQKNQISLSDSQILKQLLKI